MAVGLAIASPSHCRIHGTIGCRVCPPRVRCRPRRDWTGSRSGDLEDRFPKKYFPLSLVSSTDAQQCPMGARAYQHVTSSAPQTAIPADFFPNCIFKTRQHRSYSRSQADFFSAAVNEQRTEDRAGETSCTAPQRHALTVRSSRATHPSITARPSPEEKARFTLLAQHVGLSESALALNAIRILLERDEQWHARQPELKWGHVAASDRITIRLRPGDGLEVSWHFSLWPVETSPD